MNESRPASTLPALCQWSAAGRGLVFLLSATSIWCLLAEFYGLCSMRLFSVAILLPSSAAIAALAVVNRFRGDRLLWRAVVVGTLSGLVAACAYDLFRLPWVIGAIDRVGPPWLRLPLFKVFPRFGAMLLGESFTPTQTDSEFSLTAHVLGWAYHFSNGASFGIMFLALLGSAGRRSLLWAMAMAAFLELAMLVTPYTSYFAIKLSALFVAVTLSAHLIFGAALGLAAKRAEARWTALAR